MIRASRPKSHCVLPAKPAFRPRFRLALLAGVALTPAAGWAQSPPASSYATRDGRSPTTVLACVATDGTFTAQPCGVAGYPLHVTIDSGGIGGGASVPTTAAGTASTQLLGVQGGGSGALPVSVIDNTVAQVVVQAQLAAAALGTPNDAAAASSGSVVAQLRRIANLLAAAPNSLVNPDGGQQVHVMNLPVTQVVSALALPLPAGAAIAAAQPVLNGDGGALAHVTNFPATQPVSAAALPLPAGAATAVLQSALNGDGGSQVHVQNFPATQVVSAASLPLPSGAAQDGTDVTGVTAPPGGTGIRGWLSGIYAALSGTLKVVVQPGSAALPVAAAALPLPAGAATAAAQPALNGDGGALAHVTNLPAIQPVSAASLPLPSGAATAALQPTLNGDGGSQVHVQNFPASQPVTNGGSFAVQDSAVIANVATVAANTAPRSGAWTDASFTATATASSPSALASVASRAGLHVWNIGTSVACMNYTSAAVVSGSGCAAGSVPIPAGSAYLEDQPGNVSPEAISLVCAGASCPLTIKVR